MRRIFKRKDLVFIFILLAVYLLTIQSQGKVVSVSIGQADTKNIAVVPAFRDGAVAWMEAIFVTNVPTLTPLPSVTFTPDLARTATKTPKPTLTPTPTGPTPTVTYTITKGPSPTPSITPRASLTPTTHAYFVRYGQTINTVSTLGTSIAAQSLWVGGRLYLVIADGTHGLLIVDVTNPTNPIETRYTMFEAVSLKVIGTIAYVAAGDDGVIILDLSNPNRPFAIDHRATIGEAIDLDVYFRQAEYVDIATGATKPYVETRIYVAMGSAGVQVLTISPIAKQPPVIQNNTLQNKTYGKAVYFKTDDRVLSITEAHYYKMNEFVFIADGKNGVKVLDLFNVNNRPIEESDVIQALDIPFAWDVAFGQLLEHRAKQDKQQLWLFVAAGDEGVRVYKVAFETNPRDATYTYFRLIDTPGEARAVSLYQNNIFVGDGQGGVQVIDFNDPENPVLMESGVFEFSWQEVPVFYALRQLLIENADSPGSIATLANIFIDAVICIGGMVIVAFFMTGFILPVRSIRDRRRVLGLMVSNWLGVHSPLRVIEDGKQRHRVPQGEAHIPGVSLQDPNSATVYNRHAGRIRVSGEQITFTGEDEHVAWQTELRRRQIFVGPRHDDPDPFKTRSDNEERAEYRARQHRRRIVASKTADDVEIVPTLRIVYSLEGAPVSDQDEFGFDAVNVARAYKSEQPPTINNAEDPVKYYKRRQSVEQLLEKLVSELWRLNIERYTLEDLFPPTGEETALQNIQNMIANLLVFRQVDVLEAFGNAANITTIREDYREFAGGERARSSTGKSLPDPGRGVVVHEVKLEAIYLSDDDTQLLLQQWIEDWRQGNQPDVEELERRINQEYLIQFAEYAVQYLAERPGNQPRPQRLVENLVRLLQGTLRALPPDSPEYRRLSEVIRQLGSSER